VTAFLRLHIVSLVLLCASANAQQSFSADTLLMGVSFSFTAIHEQFDNAIAAVDEGIKEVVRIEKLISSWDKNSQTSKINANAGIAPVEVDAELIELIERSLKISEITDGYFDITFASIHKVWDFETFEQTGIPSDENLAKSIALIGFERIQIDSDKNTVFLPIAGMKIGFGAIGKGYAANRAKEIMQSLGVESGVVNAGGDVLCWGEKPGSDHWSIGIEDPTIEGNIISWIDAIDMAVVTSGNYKKYLLIDGKKYCHIVNPKTGWPVENLSSVTLICADAEIADALATSVFVLGVNDGLKLINHLNGVECLIIDSNNKMHFSDNLQKNIFHNERFN
jgi:FAD:protein FMN transferase